MFEALCYKEDSSWYVVASLIKHDGHFHVKKCVDEHT